MSIADLRGLLFSFAYVLAVLLISDLFGRYLNIPVKRTRKFVHIAVGMWVFPTLELFEHWTWALVPPLVFTVLNALSLRYRLFAAIEVQERTLGTVYFPAAFAALLALFWPLGRPEIAAAGIMALTWGDAMAAMVGEPYGRQHYRLWGQEKSWLGSLACFSWTFLSVTLTLRLVGNYPPPQALLHAILGALAAALAEALTPLRMDNLTVPLATAGILFLLISL
ncbi:MAG: phosphatidate cytidylyltransferase [Chloroflexia bacterium]|nr:phosphatidate cytidylyltransferase [Chloroflexia bacterium]